MIGHPHRYFTHIRLIRDWVSSGRLGGPVTITVRQTTDHFKDSRPRRFLSPKPAGGIVMNYGAHSLDKMTCVTGIEPIELSASPGM